MNVSFETSKFTAWIKGATEKLESHARGALDRSARATAVFAKSSDLYQSHTYNLRKSIRPELLTGYRARVVAGGSSAPYAFFVENGTRAHPIVARRAKVLRFVQNGDTVFRRRVFHPGTKPRPFMQTARDLAVPLFESLVREAITDSFK